MSISRSSVPIGPLCCANPRRFRQAEANQNVRVWAPILCPADTYETAPNGGTARVLIPVPITRRDGSCLSVR